MTSTVDHNILSGIQKNDKMARKVKLVLCIGDLVADIFTSPIANIPLPGEPIVTDKILVMPGGNSLNTAVALCRMGDQVTIGGSVGNDALGNLLLQQLNELGLDVRGVKKEANGLSASTIILNVGGEDRRYIMNLGVGASFTGEHLSFDLIPENGVVLVGGYLKLAAWNDELLADFLKEAKRKNNKVVFNVCIVQNSDVDPKRVLPLLKYVDVFLPNKDEARSITDKEDIPQQAKQLHAAGVKNVIITKGIEGLYASDGKSHINMGTFQVTTIDPSGCGDCFTAGLIAALRRGWEIIPMLKFGSAVGALGATALGCTTGVPLYEDVDQFMEKNKIEIAVADID